MRLLEKKNTDWYYAAAAIAIIAFNAIMLSNVGTNTNKFKSSELGNYYQLSAESNSYYD
jgi:hypothetical protein